MREFRAAWVATVANIDWPSKRGLPVADQKAELMDILDRAAALKLNAVIFQVRPACDALYASQLEPWSEFLTGTMGQPPRPYYDPLALAVTEAHRRGLELHAWFNPYRALHPSGKGPVAATHVSKTRPQIVRTVGKYLWLDPGERETQDYSVNVVLDVVKRYDVDGIHFDDYFYPSNYPLPEVESKDGIVANLTREHVNDLVKQVSTVIKSTNSNIQFGISPIGIWKNNTSDPTGSHTGGNEGYYSVYADPRTWIKNEWIDYIVPQIYWETTHKTANYNTLVTWWSNAVSYTHLTLPTIYSV